MRMRFSVLYALLLGGGALMAAAQPALGTDACRPGFVWREAFPGDLVCVKPITRDEVADDNRQDRARRQGDSNPWTCVQGYVWRDAFAGDFVCVTPDVRDQAAEDNRLAGVRRVGSGGPAGPLRPDTCRPGFVWREARPGDLACVTPHTRTQTANDNALAPTRLASNFCKEGYVWREARPEDHVCVVPARRDQAAFDNSQAGARRLIPACDAYSRAAIAQNAERISRNCSFGQNDNRWHSNYDNHYDWCRAADATARQGQIEYRESELIRCRSNVQFVPETKDACCSSLPPGGFILRGDGWDPTRCGGDGFAGITANVCFYMRYDNVPIGATLRACDRAPTPAGWTVVTRVWDPTSCATGANPPTQQMTVKYIKRVN